jgi:hypothetical protein
MGGSEVSSMVRGKQGIRLALALLTLTISACDAFDRGKLMPPMAGTGGMGGMPSDVDGGDTDGGVCIPTTEICNGIDDDCDGMPDTQDMQADDFCEGIILNTEASCVSTGSGSAVCVRRLMAPCDLGFSNCDGLPSNGCEHPAAMCPCATCEDAGTEDDAGDSDDSGVSP